jgi:mono/diheme cytochrome c family protein
VNLRAACLMTLLAACAWAGNVDKSKVTYTKDVAQILNQRCVECHRAGEVAPMALTSYQAARPWAKSIREKVVTRTMPPWTADPHIGEFKNDRRLAQSEIDTIVAWVNAGAPEGDPKDLPVPPQFTEGWNIGKPDQIFDYGADFTVPAEGVVDYQYYKVPTNFTEDKWIEAAEIRPQHRDVTHHINVLILTEGQNLATGALLTGFAPGVQPLRLEPGTALLVKAGSTLLFQAHYTPNGHVVKDRSFVGIRFAKQPPTLRSITDRAINVFFKIPAGDPNYPVKASWTAKQDVDVWALMPHMHFRGKDFQYTVVYPDGRQEVILNVPKYDFNWQLGYELKQPLHLPKGTRIDCVAHFDNSPNNKFNPDPTKEVRWGDQTFEEMMLGFVVYKIPVTPTPPQATSE